jgi:amino acid adenylation domain-containing protein
MNAQLKVMEQQLALLRNSHPEPQLPQALAAAEQGLADHEKKEEGALPAAAPPAALPPAAQHGPFRQLDKGAKGGLTEQQQAHLEWLTRRYVARTIKSKEYTQQHRRHFADPRAVAGFKLQWKELVYPIVSSRSAGAYLWDLDGNRWVDVTLGFGVGLLGHSPPFITETLKRQLEVGVEIGPQSPLAGEVAQLITEFTGMERVAFCNTGSEAVMAAIRLCRTVTGRSRIVFFAGDYHGTFDEVLAKGVWTGHQPKTLPLAPGVLPSLVSEVTVLEYGSERSLEWIRRNAGDLAAVLVEPVQSRNPALQPKEFLHEVRRITEAAETPLIFDEVITGFRCHPGGAQAYFGIRADLATYGKIIGGGMPIGFIAGRQEYMDALDGGFWSFGDDSFPPSGVTFFAGTFVRHPLAMAAAKAMLLHLKKEGPQLQAGLAERTRRMLGELNDHLREQRVPLQLDHFTSVWYPHFDAEVKYGSLLYYHLREKGLHIWEGRPCFLSTAHTADDEAFIQQAFKSSVAEMQKGGFFPWSGRNAKGETKVRIPITEAQQEVWIASKLSDMASCAFNESVAINFRGIFNIQAMQEAFHKIIQRHEALRITFDSSGEFQYISPSIDFDIPVFDYSESTESHRKEKVYKILKEDVSQPFDLEHGPLFRTKIFKLSGNHHLMAITAHHAVCDGWSIDVLVKDLSTAYNILTEGRSDDRPPPAMQFSDYARWQEKNRDSSEALAVEKYWLNQFADSIPVMELPTDRQRPPIKSFRGARETGVLDDAVYSQIKKLGGKNGATLFSTLLSVYIVLLYRLTGQEDMVVGVPAAGQSVVGSHDLVGHCTNLLPLRVQISGRETFKDLLGVVKKIVLDTYDNQAVTFGSLIKKLYQKRDQSRTILVSSTFNIDPAIHGMEFKYLDTEYVSNPRCAFQFDMGFNLIAYDKKLITECDYATDLFEPKTINRWIGHYHTLIANITKNEEQRIFEIPFLTEAERHQLLMEWNATSEEYPRDKTLAQLFEEQAGRTPAAAAVVCRGLELSYGELNSRVNQLAAYLRKIGVGPDSFVGICIERSLDMVVGLLGVLKAGGAYVPLDPGFPRDRLEFMLEDSTAPVLITQEFLAGDLPGYRGKIVCIDSDWAKIASENPGNQATAGAPEDLAYVIYTSGSTGKPKGVKISQRAVVNFLYSMRREPGLTAEDTLLSVTTISFDIFGLELYLPLITGAKVVLAERDDAVDGTRLIKLMRESHASVMQATPATWRLLLQAGWEGEQSLKIFCGGERLPQDLVATLLDRCKEFWNLYGPTESTIWSTIYQVKSKEDPILIGRPIANTHLYILDNVLQPVPVGVAGELHIGGDGLARGYWNRAELTAEKFIPHPFSEDPAAQIYKTGDLARYRPDGTVECLGRNDSQVKVRGFRVEPGEIESILNRHPLVMQSAVVVRTDQFGENQLVAYITPKNASVPGVSDLRQYLKELLPEYMVPSRFFSIETLPLTPNGKIDRNALPAIQDKIEGDSASSFVAAGDSLELQLTKIWESVLGVKPIGIMDNFFEIGGHSLLAARLFSKIEKAMKVKLPLATLFHASTVELLANVIRGKDWNANWSSLIPIQPGGSKPPLLFVHGAGGNVLLYRELALHLGKDQPFYGLQAQGLDGKKPRYLRFEDMAAHYVKEARSLQPEGPYFLGGYCLGGTIALEMAQQLVSQGQEVALLAMVETYNISSTTVDLPFYYGWWHRLQNLKFHWDNLWLIPTRDKLTFLLKKSRTELERMNLWSVATFSKLALKLRLPISEKYPHIDLTKANDAAHLNYLPKSYVGKITLFRPKEHFAGLNQYDFGWGEVAQQGVEVRTLPVYPRGSLVEPFVRELAKQLKECIDNDKVVR